jgi:hypothetical protein
VFVAIPIDRLALKPPKPVLMTGWFSSPIGTLELGHGLSLATTFNVNGRSPGAVLRVTLWATPWQRQPCLDHSDLGISSHDVLTARALLTRRLLLLEQHRLVRRAHALNVGMVQPEIRLNTLALTPDTSTTTPKRPTVVFPPGSFGSTQVRRFPLTVHRPRPSAPS